jgi:hypothetical protein
MNTAESEILETLDAYAEAWNSGRHADQASYYYFPTLFVFSDSVKLLKDQADCLKYLGDEVTHLKQDKFVRSVFKERNIIVLERRLAIASCIYQRQRSDGSVIEHLCATYTLQKGDKGWKITNMVNHPVQTQLRT